MDIPIILRISSGSLSTPNNPRSSITYATINCEITIRSAAFAGPSVSILLITVHVIPAPITPPRSTYLGSTFHKFPIESRPAISHAAAHSRNALNYTHPLLTHIPVVFVTCVLNTPCTLISAPDKSAIKKPVISIPPAYADNMSHDWFFMLLISKNITVPSLKSGSSHPHALFQ